MLAPQPGRTGNAPRPIKILSNVALSKAWKASKDSTARPGRPGIDNETAQKFGAKLDKNLSTIVRQLGEGRYGFSKLRVVFIPKQDSDKERVICIPTVRDRLVQRTMVAYITSRSKFPINNSSSFGFIKGLGPQSAIKRVLELRARYDWCLKTDIQSFFDRIPRRPLKAQVAKALRGNSLQPLIFKAIDCEIQGDVDDKERLRKQGVIAGRGIRQGMPLSPLLANLALSEFDKEVAGRRIGMVRYADDLVLFFRTKDEAENGHEYIKLLLRVFELSIPDMTDRSKTKIVYRSDCFDFLGREIVFLGSNNSFVARVGARQIEKIKNRLNNEFSLERRLLYGRNLQDTVVDLSKSISAYLGIYKDASNYSMLESELRGLRRSIVATIFRDLFGRECLQSLSPERKKFLGIQLTDTMEPNIELDV